MPTRTICCCALLPLCRPTLYTGPTLFILLHPVQGRRVTDVRDTSNMDSQAVSQLQECFGWMMAGASVAYGLWAGQLLALAAAATAARGLFNHE